MAPSAALLCVGLLCIFPRIESRAPLKILEDGTAQNGLCHAIPAPINGQVNCDGTGFEYKCSATCRNGYEFTTKEASVERICDQFDGTWYDGQTFPECHPVCAQNCRNGGICDKPNHCECKIGWKGNFCEHYNPTCVHPKAPAKGTVKCITIDGGVMSCSVKCDDGYTFESLPAVQYKCDQATGWDPPKNEIPNCIPIKTVGLPTNIPPHTQFHAAATCVSWSQNHYRTFDNKVYTFDGKCTYQLVGDCVSNYFAIYVVSDSKCHAGVQCHKAVIIHIGKTKIVLQKTDADKLPKIKWGGIAVSIPSSREGVVFEMAGAFVTVRSKLGGFQLKWDGKQSVFVQVEKSLKKRTCGLCGLYDGNPLNDFMVDGKAKSIADFGSFYKRDGLDKTPCPDSVQPSGCQTDTPAHLAVKQQATTNCNAMRGGDFTTCNSKIDPQSYIDACKSDCCDANNSGGCMCNSMEAYARDCAINNLKLNWRKTGRCAVSCANGMVYHESGSTCPKTCANPTATCKDASYVDGCFCPDGKVLHNGQCYSPDNCPCTQDGKDYNKGQTIPHECNTCTCNGGKWSCTNKNCDQRCSATGDPHYVTFDGTAFDFMGTCSYYLMKDKNFDVIVDNIPCGGGEETCTKSITLDYNGYNIKLDHNHQLFINGKSIKRLPYSSPGIKIQMVSSLFMKAVLGNGITIFWDGRTRAFITAPPSFMYKVGGLCGWYDGKKTNDLKTPEGNIETNPNIFGNRWKTEASCRDVAINHTDPCTRNPDKEVIAKQKCAVLDSDIFKDCHVLVDPKEFKSNCKYDTCACLNDMSECICPNIAEYAQQCAEKGIQINWRKKVPDCAVKCDTGQNYTVCGNPCTRTCNNIAVDIDCKPTCVEGCTCPHGTTLNDLHQCVPISQCPCIFDGRSFQPGFTTLKGSELCKCENARWSCTDLISHNETVTTPSTKLCPKNMVYTDCVTTCPISCSNFHDPPTCNTDLCSAGCVCEPGFVSNGVDVCVKSEECPCFHGAKAYTEGMVIKMDCNECKCQNRRWVCKEEECPAICSAVGPSHFTTFDGKKYDMESTCDYILAKSAEGNRNPFEITMENIPCEKGGVCSKAIEFTVGEPGTPTFYRLSLMRGRPIEVDSNAPFQVSNVGNFVHISIPGGVTLRWDKASRVYIELSTEHKGKVVGLCGNFNGDHKDDFTGRQGGLPIIKSKDFADHWKVHDYCQPPVDYINPCQLKPENLISSQHKCDIIKSKLFEPCHPFVDFKPYLERCEFDTCDCDTADNCELLCAAVAAYAHDCTVRGTPIAWRTPDFCPIECVDCEVYKPCISSCPKKTCDNYLHYDQVNKDCQKQPCFEGCEATPCPNGHVYNGDIEPIICVPMAFCNTTSCIFNGQKYLEGERILDTKICRPDCEVCTCNKGSIKRLGFCTTETTPSATFSSSVSNDHHTTQTTLRPSTIKSSCTDGFTPYMSIGTPSTTNIGDVETIEALRTLYSFCDESMMVSISCRVIGRNTMYDRSGQKVTCDLKKGLHCFNKDQKTPEICLDYEVRFNCNCTSPTTTVAGQTISGDTPPVVTPSGPTGKVPTRVTVEVTCYRGWTTWMNSDTPLSNPKGDFELISELRFFYSFCSTPDSIKCRSSATKEVYSYTDDIGVECDLVNGLQCFSDKQNNGRCNDYEISLHCNCGGTTESYTSPGSTVTPPTGNPLIPGHGTPYPYTPSCKWTEWMNAYPKNSNTRGDYETISLLRLHYSYCEHPVRIECRTKSWRHPTGISFDKAGQTAVTCDLNRGLICEDFLQQTGEECFDYEVRLYCIDGCSTQATPTGITGEVPTIQTHTVSNQSPLPITGNNPVITPSLASGMTPPPVTSKNYQCVHGFSEWINTNHPDSIRGDRETINSLPGYPTTCNRPISIDCRLASNDQDYKAAGQDVTCDTIEGLTCDNTPTQTCKDYRIRFYCLCDEVSGGTTVDGTTMTGGTTQTSNPLCNQTGWTEWMNTDKPDDGDGGDIESLARLYHHYTFCDKRYIMGAKCRDDKTKADSKTTNQKMTCDEKTGLTCMNTDQTDGHCLDYAIQFYCECGSAITTPVTISGNDCNMPMGLSHPDFILNKQFTASTSYSYQTVPHLARLDNAPKNGLFGVWIPRFMDDQQWIQIDFRTQENFTGIITQGRSDKPEWVQSYIIQTSVDGINFNPISDKGQTSPTIFNGNTDQNTKVKQTFDHRVTARFVRIYPVTYHGQIALRFELLGCLSPFVPVQLTPPTVVGSSQTMFTPSQGSFKTPQMICGVPMGVDNTVQVKDFQLSSSSYLNKLTHPSHGRLFYPQGYWAPETKKGYQWIQVDFMAKKKITGIITQGSGKNAGWVTKYYVEVSTNGIRFTRYREDGKVRYFTGNTDETSLQQNVFKTGSTTRYIRIVPTEWSTKGQGLRFNVIGCYVDPDFTATPHTLPNSTPVTKTPEPMCQMPMGIENYKIITESQLTASSQKDDYHAASHGRISTPEMKYQGSWIPRPTDTDPWIQVNFLEPKILSGIVLQGGTEANWVAKYNLYYSLDGIVYTPYTNGFTGDTPSATLIGNKDANTIKTTFFTKKITARYIKLRAVEAHNGVGLRFNLLGCNPSAENHLITTIPPIYTGPPTTQPPTTAYTGPTTTPYTGSTIAPSTTTDKPVRTCLVSMGVDNRYIIHPDQMSASSSKDIHHGPDEGRLDNVPIQGVGGSWMPRPDDKNPYIQVDLLKEKLISGITIQGNPENSKWMTRYEVQGSLDNKKFHPYTDIPGDSSAKLFSTNMERNGFTAIPLKFNRNWLARYVRIIPKSWTANGLALRFNILGCHPDKARIYVTVQPHFTPTPVSGKTSVTTVSPSTISGMTPVVHTDSSGRPITITGQTPVVTPTDVPGMTPTTPYFPKCDVPMGVNNPGIVGDYQISSSSQLDMYHGAGRARLYTQINGPYAGGWQPISLDTDKRPWIQVDFVNSYDIAGVKTQGSLGLNWVTEYEVEYSLDGTTFQPVTDSPSSSKAKLFTGNVDKSNPVLNTFDKISARVIRILPKKWHNEVGLRFEIYGCQVPSQTPRVDGETTTHSVGDSSTTTATPSAPTTPSTCRYYTTWVSNGKPDAKGDFESLKNMSKYVTACDAKNVEQIECRRVDNKASSFETGQIVQCDLATTSFSCANSDQGGSSCYDYEIRFLCNKCETTTTPITTTCVGTKSSEWINKDKPDTGEGEKEVITPTELEQLCGVGGMVTGIECLLVSNGESTTSTALIADCNMNTGYVCNNADNIEPCVDVKVKYQCKCAEITTTSVHTTANIPMCTHSHYTSWINKDKPWLGDGDYESLTSGEKATLCPGGTMIDIDCLTVENIDSTSTAEGNTCDLKTGSRCKNNIAPPIQCHDYKIRYYCQCSPTESTSSSSFHTTETPTPRVNIQCQWSKWYNTDSPKRGHGDLETIEQLKSIYGICKHMADIECRVAGSVKSVIDAGQKHVTCDTFNGLRCYNNEQLDKKCYDYEVRVLCWNPKCSDIGSTTPGVTYSRPPSTPSTTLMCGLDEMFTSCAYKCENLCHNMVKHEKCKPTDCISGCRKTTEIAKPVCQPGYKLRDRNKCVKDEMCACLKQDGTVAQPLETWYNPDLPCSVCRCSNNKVDCSHDDCISFTHTPGTNPVTPVVYGCGWTGWINTNTPDIDGDFEVMSKIRSKNIFCDKPVFVECRSVSQKISAKDSGQKVTCDKEKGLRCYNSDQHGVDGCLDFETRFYCPCKIDPTYTTPQTPPTPKHGNETVPFLKPVCGWTNWMSSPEKSPLGEEILLSKLRPFNEFCETDQITAIDCREKVSKNKVNAGAQSGVRCDLEASGLMCENSLQPSGKCVEYEVRFHCDEKNIYCSNKTPVIVTLPPTPTPETLTGKPVITPPIGHHSTPNIPNITVKPVCSGYMHDVHPIPVKDGYLRASSRLSNYAGAQQSKITEHPVYPYTGVWMAKKNDQSEWIEARFDTPKVITNILTQGRKGFDQWVKAYKLQYSMDGINFKDYEETAGVTKIFSANYDDYSVVKQPLYPLMAMFVRLQPVSWHGAISLRFGIIGCQAPVIHPTCKDSYWSEYINRHTPPKKFGTPGKDIEKMTPEELKIFCPTGQITNIECITTNNVSHISSNEILTCKLESGLYCDNADNSPATCSDYKVRYYCKCPEQSSTTPGMVTPTPPYTITPSQTDKCRDNMGMENGYIRDNMLTASSYYDGHHSPSQARLGSSNGWIAADNNREQFLQVDFLESRVISGLTTQGRPNVPNYVTSYLIKFSKDGSVWSLVTDVNGDPKVFSGNHDSETPVTNMFQRPIRAQYLRILPQTWRSKIALRLEVHGCYEAYTTQAPPTISGVSPGIIPTLPIDYVPEKCVIWDRWVDTHAVSLGAHGDRELMVSIKEQSTYCSDPVKIECRTATPDSKPYDSTGQNVTCNLWDGLTCKNSEQTGSFRRCFNYKVRLGCLKNVPECVQTIDKKIPACYIGMNTDNCPKYGCSSGQLCDGFRCVPKSQCTCLIEGEILRPGSLKQNSNCDTCHCFNGEVLCEQKSCASSCSAGGTEKLNVSTCSCECSYCKPNEFKCSDGLCISKSRKCDGIVDCTNDEHNCGTTSTDYCDRWSKYINRHTPPTAFGVPANENEKMTPEELKIFCPTGQVTKIECTTTNNVSHISSNEILTCTLENGLHCNGADNFPAPCSNYRVRYYCNCPVKDGGKRTTSRSGETPVTPAVTGIDLTPSLPPTPSQSQCLDRWSNLINRHTPPTDFGVTANENEKMTPEELKIFCPTGQVTKIECTTTNNVSHISSNEILTCTLENGLHCNGDDNFPAPCSNYRVRYFCKCPESTTFRDGHQGTTSRYGESLKTPVVTNIELTPSPPPTPSQSQCFSRWSNLINRHTPPTDFGVTANENEKMTPEELKIFCPTGQVTKIECTTTNNVSHISSNEILTCTLENGLHCNGDDNAPVPCSNYRVRYYCKCPDVRTTKPTFLDGDANKTNGVRSSPVWEKPTPVSSKLVIPTYLTPVACSVNKWSNYVNKHTPSTEFGVTANENEKMSPEELKIFCPTGQVTKIECTTTNNVSHISSNEILTCTLENGLQCNGADNFPAPCSNFRVRYFCKCPDECIGVECPVMEMPTLKDGEEVKVIATKKGCCRGYSVVCNPHLCPVQNINCAKPKYLVRSGGTQCCPKFSCVAVEDECKYTLLNGKTVHHKVDETWTDGLCKSCTCKQTADGSYHTNCQSQQCPTCKLGEVGIARINQCCNECQSSGCVVDNKLYKEGENIQSKKKCHTKHCIKDISGHFMLQENQISCTAVDKLPTCTTDIIEYDSDGCCAKCVPKTVRSNSTGVCLTCQPKLMFTHPKQTVGYFKVQDGSETCHNNQPINDLKHCTGSCGSSATYTDMLRGFDNTCSCCVATETTMKNIQLVCGSGRQITRPYNIPVSCACGLCGN